MARIAAWPPPAAVMRIARRGFPCPPSGTPEMPERFENWRIPLPHPNDARRSENLALSAESAWEARGPWRWLDSVGVCLEVFPDVGCQASGTAMAAAVVAVITKPPRFLNALSAVALVVPKSTPTPGPRGTDDGCANLEDRQGGTLRADCAGRDTGRWPGRASLAALMAAARVTPAR